MDNIKRVKLACYTANVSGAVVANLSPLLFLTFHELYGISYSLLGLLVLINFCTQLIIDLIFSFFSHRFNITLTVRITPVLTALGLISYALLPFLMPNNVYLAVAIGTVLFSLSGGLGEVLLSPTVAALPSDNPEREMSKLHSAYAWGVVAVVVVSTVFFLAFGEENWQWLALGFAIIPLFCTVLFMGADIPKMETPKKTSGALGYFKNPYVWLCVFAIFLGGASECTMGQWCSGYVEAALGLPKVFGDLFGVALFSVMLGLGRSLYAKYGKNIERVLFCGGIGAAVCYLVAALTDVAVVGLFACALTGFFVSMLWPGSLLVAEGRVLESGVFIFAIMAAGGDLGASVGPQLVGVVADTVAANMSLASVASDLGMTMEQLGMKCGMLVGAVFPILAILVYGIILKTKKAKM